MNKKEIDKIKKYLNLNKLDFSIINKSTILINTNKTFKNLGEVITLYLIKNENMFLITDDGYAFFYNHLNHTNIKNEKEIINKIITKNAEVTNDLTIEIKFNSIDNIINSIEKAVECSLIIENIFNS